MNRKKAKAALVAGILYWLGSEALQVILRQFGDNIAVGGLCLYLLLFAPIFIAVDRWNYSDEEES